MALYRFMKEAFTGCSSRTSEGEKDKTFKIKKRMFLWNKGRKNVNLQKWKDE